MWCDFLQKGNMFGKSYQQWDYHAFPFDGSPQIQTWGANLQGGWSRGLPLCSASRNCGGDCTWPKGWPNHPSQRLNFWRRCSYGEWATRVHNGCRPKWTSLYNRYVCYYLFFQSLGWVGFFHHDSFIDKTKAKQREYRGGGGNRFTQWCVMQITIWKCSYVYCRKGACMHSPITQLCNVRDGMILFFGWQGQSCIIWIGQWLRQIWVLWETWMRHGSRRMINVALSKASLLRSFMRLASSGLVLWFPPKQQFLPSFVVISIGSHIQPSSSPKKSQHRSWKTISSNFQPTLFGDRFVWQSEIGVQSTHTGALCT